MMIVNDFLSGIINEYDELKNSTREARKAQEEE